MNLVEPSVQYKDSFLSAVKEFQADPTRAKRYLDLSLPDLEADFDAFVEKEKGYALGNNLPDEYVPSTTLWLIDNDEFIGAVRIRHRLTAHLEKVGGHIGYDIRPGKRRLGYGSKILELAIPKAKELGIERMLLTCDVDNLASRKIIEKNGGVLQDHVPNPDGGADKMRFWINT